MNRFLSALLAVLLLSGPAFSQAVQQSGTVTPGHIPSWVTSGVIKDAGSATSSSITEMGVTKNGGLPFCVNSANTGALNRLCLTSTTNSGAKLTVTDQGGATDGTLTIEINGNSVILPAAPGGTVLPTVLTTPAIADSAPTCFSGTDGTLKSCGGTPGTGTVTSVAAGTGIAASPDPITTSGTISLAPIASGNLLGNSSGVSAAPTVQTVGSGLSLAMDTLQIGTASVTNAMLANVATKTLKGRSTAGTGSPEDISVGTGLQLSGGVLSTTPSATTLPGYIFGLTLSNNGSDATNDIDIATGRAADNSSGAVMALSGALTKQTDTSWTVGTNQGCLDTGVVGNGTYHFFLIERSDTGVVDVLCSLSPTAPTMPANYDISRRIGSVLRESGSIVAFVQNGNIFYRSVPVRDVNVTNPGTSAVTRTLSVPTGIVVDAIITVQGTNTSNNFVVLVTALSQADTAASTANGTLFVDTSTGGSTSRSSEIRRITNTSAQIRTRQSASGGSDAFSLITFGWVDMRGQYSTP